MTRYLERIRQDDSSLYGLMKGDGYVKLGVTLERLFYGKPKIPAGTYVCKRRFSGRFQCDVFEVTGVPFCTFIEIHPANYVTQLEGCVGIGTAFGPDMITQSRLAFDKFMADLQGVDEFNLIVSDPS